MVFLAITSSGLAEALRLTATEKSPIWCGSDALTEAQFQALETSNVTRFIYPLGGHDPEIIAGAVETINEHHPNERIWVEYEPQP